MFNKNWDCALRRYDTKQLADVPDKGSFDMRHDLFGKPMHLLKQFFLRIDRNRHRGTMIDAHCL